MRLEIADRLQAGWMQRPDRQRQLQMLMDKREVRRQIPPLSRTTRELYTRYGGFFYEAMRIPDIIDEIIDVEGGYSDNPDDSGGPTRWGVTEAVARADGYLGDMRDYPRESAHDLLMRKYYYDPNFHQVAEISKQVAYELTDTGVNCGVTRAGIFLQRSLNGLNRKQEDYPDMKIDGKIGPATLTALRKYKQVRGLTGEKVLLRLLNGLQCARYLELCEAKEKNETFLFGWVKDRVVIN